MATAQTGGTVLDQSSTLNSYTVTQPVNANNYTFGLQGEVQAANAVHLILRQNGTFVSDLSNAGSATPAPPNFSVQYNNGADSLGGSSNLLFNPTAVLLTIGAGGGSGPSIGANAAGFLTTSAAPPASDSSTALAATENTVSLLVNSITFPTVNANTTAYQIFGTGHVYQFGANALNTPNKQFHVHQHAYVTFATCCETANFKYGVNIGGGTNDVVAEFKGQGTGTTMEADLDIYCMTTATGTSGTLRCSGRGTLSLGDGTTYSVSQVANQAVTLDLTAAETVSEEASFSANASTANSAQSEFWGAWRDN